MNKKESSQFYGVQQIEIELDQSGQRIDNFLITRLKGVPKTRIYRIIRKGEVRVNKGRISNQYRLQAGDMVRIPPIRVATRQHQVDLQPTLKYSLEHDILYEDDILIVLNKPSGFAVHGGSGIRSGVIEAIRVLRPDVRFLELVHRLDKATSGCLLVAKKRSALKALQLSFRNNQVKKTYLALLTGCWSQNKQIVTEPLLRSLGTGGERWVKVHPNGKFAETLFRKVQQFNHLTLVEASPKTGRTHQIRVHAAWLGHPIVGDDRYGDYRLNTQLKLKGYQRLFLHAEQLQFSHPVSANLMHIKAPLPTELLNLLKHEKKI